MSWGPRWGGRTDENHREVRDGLRKLGWTVRDTSSVGGGFPDLTVSRWGWTDLVEVKRASARGRKRGKVQAGTDQRQAEFRTRWDAPVIVAESLDEAERELLALYLRRRERGKG